jgi:anti-sigma regulatory factor (Ser/Thr protein kinase)
MKNIASAQFSAEYNQLEPIRRFVEINAVKIGIPADVVYDLTLSITEITTNVIKHGYKEKAGSIEVILGRQGSDFIIKIRDDATIFDPRTVPEPDLSLPLDKMPLGGLGLYMTKNLVDSLSHSSTPNGGNEITLVKLNIIKV